MLKGVKHILSDSDLLHLYHSRVGNDDLLGGLAILRAKFLNGFDNIVAINHFTKYDMLSIKPVEKKKSVCILYGGLQYMPFEHYGTEECPDANIIRRVDY